MGVPHHQFARGERSAVERVAGNRSWLSIMCWQLIRLKLTRRMDYASRELYRNTVAEYAERSDCSELEIAQLALQLALDSQKQKHADPRLILRRSHIGYYLIGEGAEELRGRADVVLPWKQRIQNFLRRHPDEFYLGGIEALTLLIVIAIMTPVYGLFSSFWTRIFGILVLLLPAARAQSK